MNFQAQAKKKDTPSRRSRKGQRNSSFIFNKSMRSRINREKRAARAANNA